MPKDAADAELAMPPVLARSLSLTEEGGKVYERSPRPGGSPRFKSVVVGALTTVQGLWHRKSSRLMTMVAVVAVVTVLRHLLFLTGAGTALLQAIGVLAPATSLHTVVLIEPEGAEAALGVPESPTALEYWHEQAVFCAHTLEHPLVLTDSLGQVCARDALDPERPGCCSAESSERYSCENCQESTSCCDAYETCVSCCVDPQREEELLDLMERSEHPVIASTVSAFELCRYKCRTSSASVLHQNSYLGATRYCYGEWRPSREPGASVNSDGTALHELDAEAPPVHVAERDYYIRPPSASSHASSASSVVGEEGDDREGEETR